MNKQDLQVFIFRPLKPEERDELNGMKSIHQIVSIDSAFNEGIELQVRVLNNLDIEHHDSFAKECIQNLGHQSLKSRLSLIDQTTFEGVVLWHPVRFGVYHKFKHVLIQKSILDALNTDVEGSTLVYTSQPLLGKVFSRADIRLAQPAINKSKTISPLKFAALFLIRSVVGFIKNGLPVQGKRIVFNTVSSLSPMISEDGANVIRGVPHIHYFLKKVESDDSFALVSAMKFIGVKDGLFPIWETCNSSYPSARVYHFESFVLASLLSLDSFKKLFTYWRGLSRSEFEGSGVVDQMLIADFKQRRMQFTYAAVLTLGSFRMMKKMQPKCIGGDNEHNFVKRPIFGAAKQLGIPTYAIQHGDIHRDNFNYRFTQDDPIGQLHPDVTAVWGAQTKESLIHSSLYNPTHVHIVGQIRTDVIPELKKKVSKNDAERAFTVLFASQPFFDHTLRKRMYRDFCESARSLPNITFVHKPHPGETDWSFFDKMDGELGFKVDRSDQDLYTLLAQTDLVVTGFSTVGIEAAYFDRDLIVLDYQKTDLAGYAKNKVALQANNSMQLSEFIKSISEGDELLNPVDRQNYIAQRVHAIDGKTSERLKAMIESL